MIDLNYKRSAVSSQRPEWEPEEIAVAVLALVIWIPMAYIFGGLL